MTTITEVEAIEVLDSRGNPTVRTTVRTEDAVGVFTVPSGASTGKHEAVEVRDGAHRYDGKGVQQAVECVNEELAQIVVGSDVTQQRTLDEQLEAYDGTTSLGNVGANAILGVSGAVAHAAGDAAAEPLHRYLSEKYGAEPSLPMPMVNIISGGLHAKGGIEIQDFLVIPRQATSIAEALEIVWNVRNAVRTSIVEDGHRPLVADEGGFAPPMDTIDEAFEILLDGIERAGYTPGEQVVIAMDVAASHFYDSESETYRLESTNRKLTPDEMASMVVSWTESYPIVSIEDPLAEDDWHGWTQLAEKLDESVQLLGDDLLVTNPERLDRAIDEGAASAVLVKPNQAGTLSKAIDVIRTAQREDVSPVVSARSGETCDTTIADVAVGLNAGQIKIGSLSRSERLAKYNRLLEIEQRESFELSNPF
ncbi:phosphopyruvate hydratase [Haloferax sp. Atlit-4N]|uniref:phosphopyruvate hydratase n=1 Tax=unclassified Haloferax TaxID=2625095 RepID=UPI000E27D734|nr:MULTISPECIES: phosphopyruvate hydratase [unclassified Haloferax]RDZ39499.1 phosphopyruvate hydratase [Haloferax sp. Atlit-19N]RDZ50225.1 phosphopyruvate hydratase [Haloferax sp. Atlit-4N]